jgi:Protein of unknown function (DUF3179)
MPVSKGRKYVHWLPIVALTIVGLGLFLIPALIIRPFQHQSSAALSLAISVKWIAPLLTLVTLGGVLVLGTRLWRGSSWAVRTGLALAILLSTAAAVMVRLNYFEWMFRPIPAAGFLAATEAGLSDAEMVMTVRLGPEARAYPIRQMAYHHILNDTVGGVPIVVTY